MECFDLVGVDGEGDCDMVLNERYMLERLAVARNFLTARLLTISHQRGRP